MTLASGAKSKPALEESSFQQILAAAYVVQQHNDGVRAKDPAQNTSSVLSEIAEIQSLIRAGGLDLNAAGRLAVERLRKIARADGASIFIMRNGELECLAEAGTAALYSGSCCTADSIIANEKLKSGELFESSDTLSDPLLNGASCRKTGAGSLIAAPIHRFDEYAGLIELRSARVNGFQEGDGRAARLMSGLIGGLLERNARAQGRDRIPLAGTSKALPISTRDLAAGLPNFERERFEDAAVRAEERETPPASSAFGDRDVFERSARSEAAPAPQFAENELPDECRVCGRHFSPEESFCGQCSMPRVAGGQADDLQSKWASLWYLQKAQQKLQKPTPLPPLLTRVNPPQDTRTPADAGVRIWHVPEAGPSRSFERVPIDSGGLKPVAHDESLFYFGSADAPPSASTVASSPAVPVTSVHGAATDEDLLQSTWHAVWERMRRRHATLALTAVGLLLLFLMLAVWPSSKNSQLTWAQSLLVQLGLADVPSHPVSFSGNADARVWVDVHTALYYCQGSDLYGKTPGGHFASQHDAQQDEFEPASRIACP